MTVAATRVVTPKPVRGSTICEYRLPSYSTYCPVSTDDEIAPRLQQCMTNAMLFKHLQGAV
jgi:hypothetical protein